MSIKKIIFQQATNYVEGLLKMPNPSISKVPDWYKEQKMFSNGEATLLKAMKGNWKGTYKGCTPFTDAITSGYIIELPADVIVTNKGDSSRYKPFIEWGVQFDVLDFQGPETLGNFPVPVGYSNEMFRWKVNWQIKTPPGYSSWICHPTNRYDLPFITLTGFVDTDKHPAPLVLPFFIQNGFEGIIKEGTPIAQILPMKRDSWESYEEKYSEQSAINFINSVKLNYIRTYKNKYWTKKKYG